MSLPTARLSTTDLEITRVGFGAWALGGGSWVFGWGSQDDQDSVAAIRHAVDHGINLIDTAAVYGLGHSEEVVGQAITGVPGRPFIFTKCGMLWDGAWNVARVARPDTIPLELEASLRRLGVERIDLYQVHWPPEDGTPVEEYWQTMVQSGPGRRLASCRVAAAQPRRPGRDCGCYRADRRRGGPGTPPGRVTCAALRTQSSTPAEGHVGCRPAGLSNRSRRQSLTKGDGHA